MSMLKNIFILILIAGTYPVSARMYQWVDPGTGTTQLSGKPPAWYRNGEKGPRIFVFENGNVIDDTGIAVNEDQREMLRQQALIRVEKDKEAAKREQLEASRLKAVMERKRKSEEQREGTEVAEPEAKTQEAEPAKDQPSKEKNIEKMQALIRQWEQLQTENARSLVGSEMPAAAGSAPVKDSSPGN